MKEYQQVRERIAGIEGVAATTPFYLQPGDASNGNGVAGMVIRALDTHKRF